MDTGDNFFFGGGGCSLLSKKVCSADGAETFTSEIKK